MNSEQIFKEIREKREYGMVHLAVFDRNPKIPWENDLAEQTLQAKVFSWNGVTFYRKNKKSAEQQPISKDEVSSVLTEIDQTRAINALAQLLHRDMAYGAEMLRPSAAYNLAADFVDLFRGKARYFSNSTWQETVVSEHTPFGIHLSGWADLTNATFDSGIIILNQDRIGIAWFEDED